MEKQTVETIKDVTAELKENTQTEVVTGEVEDTQTINLDNMQGFTVIDRPLETQSIFVKVVGKNHTYYGSYVGDMYDLENEETVNRVIESFVDMYSKTDEIITSGTCTEEEYRRETGFEDVGMVSQNAE